MRKRLKRAGWTGYTYALSVFFLILFVAVMAVAVNGNPASQLSILCYAVLAALVAAAVVALFDRRK